MKNSSKLERFDNTLNNLEEELTKLKTTSQAYKKLEELSSSYKIILEQFEQNNLAIQKQIANYKKSKEVLNDIIEDNQKNYEQLRVLSNEQKSDIEETLDNITNNNQENYKELKSLNNDNQKELNTSLEELRKENRQFYLDFEKVVRIKLDEHKSEIKQLIENERLKVKEIIDNKIDKQTDLIMLNQKKINTITLVFGITSTLLLIGILIKLFI